jgi:hypothetical protein
MRCIELGERTLDAMVLGARHDGLSVVVAERREQQLQAKEMAPAGKANYTRSEGRRQQKRIAYQGRWRTTIGSRNRARRQPSGG